MTTHQEKTVEILRGVWQLLLNRESVIDEEGIAKAMAAVAEAALSGRRTIPPNDEAAHEAVTEALEAEGVFNGRAHDAALPRPRYLSGGVVDYGTVPGKVFVPAIVASLFEDEDEDDV